MRIIRWVVVSAFVITSVAIVTGSADARAALFGPDAGFHQARFGGREPIRVENADWLRQGVRYWNERARWDVFVLSDDPQITVVNKDCGACATAYSSVTGGVKWIDPYARCEVWVRPQLRTGPKTVAHELGHCLGLRHQDDGVMSDAASLEIKPGYKQFDRDLLERADYAA